MISKKWLTSGMMLLSVSLLVACSGNETIPGFKKSEDMTTEVKSEANQSKTNSSETTTTVTESTTETTPPAVGSMDINVLAQGNYSSIAGRWVNNNGIAIIIDESGNVLYEDYSDTPHTINLSAGSTEGGLLRVRMDNPNAPELAPIPTYFVPAGISFNPTTTDVTDTSDKSKDRILSTSEILTTEILETEVFYRVE